MDELENKKARIAIEYLEEMKGNVVTKETKAELEKIIRIIKMVEGIE